MKKQFLLPVFLTLAVGVLAGCSSSGTEFEVKFKTVLPTAHVDEPLDFSKYIEREDGVEYTLKAFYQNPNEFPVEHELPVDGFTFTPVSEAEITLELTGTKGSKTSTRTKAIPCTYRGDPIDELVITGGWSGYADNGFKKTLNTNPAFMKMEGKSSIYINYTGTDRWEYGGSTLCIQNFRCLDEFTDKEWKNAAITAWVYNPTNYDITFGLRIVDDYTKTVDTDWGSNCTYFQNAKPNQWTQIMFSLRALGVDHTLLENESGSRKDAVTIKTQWAGRPSLAEEGTIYTYKFYVDGLDVVPATYFPSLKTDMPDKNSRMLMFNGWCDTSRLKPSFNFDPQYTKSKNCSVRFDFIGNSQSNGTQVVALNSPKLQTIWSDFNSDGQTRGKNSILTAWIYNPTDFDLEFQIFIYDKKTGHYVDWGQNYNDSQYVKANSWGQIFFSLRKEGIERPLVHEKGAKKKDELTIKVDWKGDIASKAFFFYMDDVDIAPSSKYPEINTDNNTSSETIECGLENLAIDVGYSRSKVKYDRLKIYNHEGQEPQSTSSAYLTFNNTTQFGGANNPSVTFNPQQSFKDEVISVLPNLSNSTLSADVYFSSDITNHSVSFYAYQGKQWEIFAETSIGGLVDLGDGWYHFSVDLSAIPSFAPLDAAIRLCFRFDGVSELNKETANIRIDNIKLVGE